MVKKKTGIAVIFNLQPDRLNIFAGQRETEYLLAFLGIGNCNGYPYIPVSFGLGPIHERKLFGDLVLKLGAPEKGQVK